MINNQRSKSVFLKITIFLLLSSCHLVATANDTAFGGEGAAPYPIEQSDIAMLAEKIIISGHNLTEPKKGFWNYNCHFLFKNESNKPLTIQMGFPFPINDETSNLAIPAGRHVNTGDALIYDFKVQAKNKIIPVQRKAINANKEKGLFYKDAYLWHLTFAPKEQMMIEHHYLSGATFDVMGFNWLAYVLKTGGLWKRGRIGLTEIEVIPNTPTRLCSELDSKSAYLKPKPKGLKISGKVKSRIYTWQLRNFKPTEDLSLCLQTGANYVRYRIIYPLLEDDLNRLHHMTSKELYLLKNTIYAQYGKSFDNSELKTYFNQQWWYESNPNYTDKKLTDDDKRILKVINNLEAKSG